MKEKKDAIQYLRLDQTTTMPSWLLKDFRTGNQIIAYKISTATHTHRSSYDKTPGLHVLVSDLWRKTEELE